MIDGALWQIDREVHGDNIIVQTQLLAANRMDFIMHKNVFEVDATSNKWYLNSSEVTRIF